MRNTDFTFKAKWMKAIALLPADYQAPATNAILSYAYFGTIPDDPVINAFLTLITDEIDSETRRRDRIEEKRKAGSSESRVSEPLPERQLAADVRNYICRNFKYAPVFRRNIINKSPTREEADSKLDRIILSYHNKHPEITDIKKIAHSVCDRIEKGMYI